MKTLFLLRHAKSSWEDASLSDFERPLNKRGEKAAPLMGRQMMKRRVKPDLVICSPANRARATAELSLTAAGLYGALGKTSFDDRLYLATGCQVQEILWQLDDKVKSVLLIGHNPGLEDLLESLTGKRRHMVTGALACLLLDIALWSSLKNLCGRLNWLATPKDTGNA